MNKLLRFFAGRPVQTVDSTSSIIEEAGQILRDAQIRNEGAQRLEVAVERATGRAMVGVKYWDIGIPRPDPGHNRQEITELKLKIREAGMLAQAVQLEQETDKRILGALKGLKSLAEGITKVNKERGNVQKDINSLRDELLKTYPPTQ